MKLFDLINSAKHNNEAIGVLVNIISNDLPIESLENLKNELMKYLK